MIKYIKFYESRGLTIEKAMGQYLWDINGIKYLDFHTGHGVAFLGHNNPHVINALKSQFHKVMALTPTFDVKVREEMLDVLAKIIPARLGNITLLNSGSEAVEFSLKVARKVSKRKKIIAFSNAFHGRTFGALSVTWNPKYRKYFEPLLPEVTMIKFNSISDLEAYLKGDVGCVIVELVQGEGGINVAKQEFIKYLRNKCDEVGAVLIFDEVQTGFGRTGRVWAFEHYGVLPDILIAGKAIGGGFPVSLVAMSDELTAELSYGDHGSTYGGNPLACAAVKASTEVLINDNVPQKAYSKGLQLLNLLTKELSENKLVREIRGLGLMLGIELKVLPTNIIKCLQLEKVIALKAGRTVVRLLPPYVITKEDIEWGVSSIVKCINKELSNKLTHRST